MALDLKQLRECVKECSVTAEILDRAIAAEAIADAADDRDYAASVHRAALDRIAETCGEEGTGALASAKLALDTAEQNLTAALKAWRKSKEQ